MIPHKRVSQPWSEELQAEPPPAEDPLPVYEDMDDLAGGWNEEQAHEFFAATAEFGRVDDALWR